MRYMSDGYTHPRFARVHVPEFNMAVTNRDKSTPVFCKGNISHLKRNYTFITNDHNISEKYWAFIAY